MTNVPNTPMKDDELKHIFMIAFAMLGTICSILFCGAFAFYFGVNTITEKQKSVAATEQVQATATAVFQSTQVAGYELFDDFEDNDNQWTDGYESNEFWSGDLSLEDGMYVWDIKDFYKDNPSSSWRTFKDRTIVTDFDMSVDAKLSIADVESMCYGVSFRVASGGISKGGYVFTICDDQGFYVEYNEAEGDTTLVPWTNSQAIRPGEWNTLAVKARGDHFVLYINNEVVAEFSDSRLEKGYVSLMFVNFDSLPAKIMFDNFGLQSR